MMERETDYDLNHITSSVKHGGANAMAWACMAASRNRSLVFGGNVITVRITWMTSEVYIAIL